MRLILLLLAVLLLPVPALAANWVFVIADADGFRENYVDTQSKQPLADGHYRIWYKKVFQTEKMDVVTLVEFTCTGEMRELEKYTKNTQTYKTESMDINNNWSYVRPSTAEQYLEEAACKK